MFTQTEILVGSYPKSVLYNVTPFTYIVGFLFQTKEFKKKKLLKQIKSCLC